MAVNLPMAADAEPPFPHVAIIGYGLIGASLGMALRARWPKIMIIAIDRKDVVETAMRAHAADVGGEDLGLAGGAELIVLAAPVRANVEILAALPDYVSGKALVTDVSSTKRQIVEAACALPPRLTFIGGHPLAGAAVSGIDAARQDLFTGRPWLLTRRSEDEQGTRRGEEGEEDERNGTRRSEDEQGTRRGEEGEEGEEDERNGTRRSEDEQGTRRGEEGEEGEENERNGTRRSEEREEDEGVTRRSEEGEEDERNGTRRSEEDEGVTRRSEEGEEDERNGTRRSEEREEDEGVTRRSEEGEEDERNGTRRSEEGEETKALEDLEAVIAAIGARPVRMDAEAHDRLIAFISHLPQFTASALMQVIGLHAGAEGLALSGRGLRDTTRLATSPGDIWRDIGMTNADNIGVAIDALILLLQTVKAGLANGEAVENLFDSARQWKRVLDSPED